MAWARVMTFSPFGMSSCKENLSMSKAHSSSCLICLEHLLIKVSQVHMTRHYGVSCIILLRVKRWDLLLMSALFVGQRQALALCKFNIEKSQHILRRCLMHVFPTQSEVLHWISTCLSSSATSEDRFTTSLPFLLIWMAGLSLVPSCNTRMRGLGQQHKLSSGS